jgi:hypothetical protein
LANIIIVLLFPIAAMCRSTWRKEIVIYVLHSFKCYLHEHLDLIIIFCTLLPKLFLKRYILADIIIVLLFPIAAICRSTWREEAIIYKYISILNTCFKPRANKSHCDVTMMWAHTSNESSHWTPNHFLPLVTLQSGCTNPINIDSFVDFPPLSPLPSN